MTTEKQALYDGPKSISGFIGCYNPIGEKVEAAKLAVKIVTQ